MSYNNINEGGYNITSPRTLAVGLYVFLTLNVILICVFLMVSRSGLSQIESVTPQTVKASRSSIDLLSGKVTPQIRKEAEEKSYKTLFKSAKQYIQKGDAVADTYTRVENYDKALEDLIQIPKRPKYQKEISSYIDSIRDELKNFSTLKIKIGDTQDKLKQAYKEPDKVVILEKYFPEGSMKYLYYDELGVRFGLNKERIYSIKFESNFKGIFHGIKIDDSIHKIKRILSGRVISLAGGNYGFQELDRKTTYLFVNNDDLTDGIEQFDKAIYGKWNTVFE